MLSWLAKPRSEMERHVCIQNSAYMNKAQQKKLTYYEILSSYKKQK